MHDSGELRRENDAPCFSTDFPELQGCTVSFPRTSSL
jgi:hypothetical protein